MQIAPSIRIGQSELNLLLFFTGRPDFSASSSSGKYCSWTILMTILEAAYISDKLILLTMLRMVRLDSMK